MSDFKQFCTKLPALKEQFLGSTKKDSLEFLAQLDHVDVLSHLVIVISLFHFKEFSSNVINI